MKATRNGSMFSVTLCDEDQSSTIRAVCFTKDRTKEDVHTIGVQIGAVVRRQECLGIVTRP